METFRADKVEEAREAIIKVLAVDGKLNLAELCSLGIMCARVVGPVFIVELIASVSGSDFNRTPNSEVDSNDLH